MNISYTGVSVGMTAGPAIGEGPPTTRPFNYEGGAVRFRNVGVYRGQAFDSLVTVKPAENPNIDISYEDPGIFSTQAVVTSTGMACVLAAILPSTCAHPSISMDPDTALCAEGGTTMKGTYFNVAFVRAGTSIPMPPFDMVFASVRNHRAITEQAHSKHRASTEQAQSKHRAITEQSHSNHVAIT